MARSSTKSARSRYPIFSAFGGEHEFLSESDAITATADERIRSVWPFLVERVLNFSRTLKARESVNFDPEDTAIELYVALKENDHEWNPERGKYITFAGFIVQRELCAIRDKSRTVHSPSNSSGRMKEYLTEEDEGTITPRRSKTANDIRRTSDGIASHHGLNADMDRPHGEDAEVIAATKEAHLSASDAIAVAIRERLTATESSVLGRLTGLWGNTPVSPWELSYFLGIPESEVRLIQSRARRKLRSHLIDIGHPITIQF